MTSSGIGTTTVAAIELPHDDPFGDPVADTHLLLIMPPGLAR